MAERPWERQPLARSNHSERSEDEERSDDNGNCERQRATYRSSGVNMERPKGAEYERSEGAKTDYLQGRELEATRGASDERQCK